MRRRRPGPGHARRICVVALLALALAGCGGEDIFGPPPAEGRAGLYLTGTVAGRQVVVSDGAPRLFLGDCQPATGPSEDVCFISRDLDGGLFVLLLRNPEALTPDVTLPVEDPGCVDCDDVSGVAVVDVRLGERGLLRATGGSLTLRTVEPALHYVGRVRLELAVGQLSGDFDVTPTD